MTDGHPRSQEAVSEDGRRWRKCAGACIVNSKGHAAFRSGIEGVDFTGTWARDNSRSVGLVEAMQARGHSADEAVALAAKPYVQAWRRGPAPSEWTVATFKGDDTSA
uniref:Uncharacterized protein n=1 Tax=Alexandrium monilatum TaxID=311494 RepID=A0A7S4R138_9DINO